MNETGFRLSRVSSTRFVASRVSLIISPTTDDVCSINCGRLWLHILYNSLQNRSDAKTRIPFLYTQYLSNPKRIDRELTRE